MKRLLPLLPLLAFSMASQAQISQGQFLVGGAGSFISQNSKSSAQDVINNAPINSSSKYHTIGIAADAGYFVIRQLALGVRGSYSYSSQTQNQSEQAVNQYYISNNTSKIYAFDVGPFARYYILPGSGKFNVFADLSYSWGKTYSKDQSFTATVSSISGLPTVNTSAFIEDVHTSTMAGAAGAAWFFNVRSALELQLGYKWTNGNNGFPPSHGFIAGIGFHSFLGPIKRK